MSFMSKITTAAAVAAFSVAAVPAANAAVIYTVTGTTAGGPTFNRPSSTTSLSGVGTAVAYNTFLFSTTTAGSYTFLLTSTVPAQAFDTYLLLYTGVFNPASPLTNLVTLNDDLTTGNFSQSGFTVTLDPNLIYTAVITGFDNLDFGNYTFTISDAVANAVPEPATWGMMVAGFGMVGFGLRRRAKPSVRVTYA